MIIKKVLIKPLTGYVPYVHFIDDINISNMYLNYYMLEAIQYDDFYLFIKPIDYTSKNGALDAPKNVCGTILDIYFIDNKWFCDVDISHWCPVGDAVISTLTSLSNVDPSLWEMYVSPIGAVTNVHSKYYEINAYQFKIRHRNKDKENKYE